MPHVLTKTAKKVEDHEEQHHTLFVVPFGCTSWSSRGDVAGPEKYDDFNRRTPIILLLVNRMPDVPYKVDKPWGYELIWARTDRYVGKVLHVKAGQILSLQYHNFKDETMHVWRGELILRTRDGDRLVERQFKAGDSVHVPAKLVHQIEAVVDSDVLEASTPELDDLVRVQDRYGRS